MGLRGELSGMEWSGVECVEDTGNIKQTLSNGKWIIMGTV